MRRTRRIGVENLAVMILVLSAGCSAGRETPERPAVERPTKPAAPEQILLRTTLVPGATPQAVSIQLHERRETSGGNAGEFVHELDLELAGTLTREKEQPGGETEAKLTFERIKLGIGVSGEAENAVSYDSTRDEPGQGNPLADVMVHFKGAEATLLVGPSGRLRELSGLNQCWAETEMIMAPPALVTAQWLFRDESMRELVAEALFPPMPAMPVTVGDAWEVMLPANIPLAARLDARVRSMLSDVEDSGDGPDGAGWVRIEGQGKLEPAPPILPGDTPAIRPAVKAGSITITQKISPQSRSLEQESSGHLEVLLTLTPPTGDERAEMTIKQTRNLVSTRADR